MKPLESGATGRVERRVTADLTAEALGSGDVPVLGTPAVLALMEAACCAALEGRLPEGATTVGTTATLEHLAATKVGGHVTATATLDAVDGKILSFVCELLDGMVVAARGRHTRAIVDRERFLARLG